MTRLFRLLGWLLSHRPNPPARTILHWPEEET